MRYPDEAAGLVALAERVCRGLPSNHPLAGTAALVTGASIGIGAAIQHDTRALSYAAAARVALEAAAAGGLARNTEAAAAGEIAVLHPDEAT